LARCIAEIGSDEASNSFAWYEANRKPRVRKVQQISMVNTWLQSPIDPEWFFGYDACVVSMEPPDTISS
jgi:6-hydroxynicotinate 3-monooxygenase